LEPGVLAVVLSLLTVWYFFIPPFWSFAVDAGAVPDLLLFALTAALLVVICEGYRRERAARLRDYQLFKTMQEISLEGLALYRAVRNAAGEVVDFEYRYANPAALAITGKESLRELEGVSLLTRLPLAREHPALFPRYVEVLATGKPSQTEYELGGQWYQSVVAKLDDGVVVTVQGINERKRAESAQQLLLQELNHRVKNLLATVIAMASLSGRLSASPAEYREALLDRLQALSRAHGLLSGNAWTDADVSSVINSTLEPYLEADRQRFEIAGESLRVDAAGAIALHMALHELATNAIKYGALSHENGRVTISWARADSTFALLTWTETGGPLVQPPERRGLGARLFETAFASEGGSTVIAYEPTGVVCQLKFRWLVQETASAAPYG
jgi:two-component sensor histidine kinase/PAS domain-containing protein